jgi:hypothetical protein
MTAPVKRASSKKAAVAVPENRTESEVVADALLTRYNDLAPSLNKIMDAGLSEAGRLHAITLFQQSLGVTGDPMRNPQNAIAAGRLIEGQAEAQAAPAAP